MTRVGIALEGSQAAVVVTERAEAVWTAIVGGGGSVPDLEQLLRDALSRPPVPRWPPARLHVVLGSPYARVKHIRGVPRVRTRRALCELLALNATRFIAAPRQVEILGVQSLAPGEALVAVTSQDTLESIHLAAATARVRLRSVMPAAALQGDATAPVNAEMSDQGLAKLALAAAQLSRSPLALDPGRAEGTRRQDVPRWRVAAAGLALAVGLAAGATVPVYRAAREARADVQARDSIAAAADSAAADARELALMRRDLERVAAFTRGRISTVLLLDAITDALPPDAVVTTLHVDTAWVDIVTISVRAASVVSALGDSPGVAAPVLVGPVSRETVGGRELERATIRLALLRGDTRGRKPFTTRRELDGG